VPRAAVRARYGPAVRPPSSWRAHVPEAPSARPQVRRGSARRLKREPLPLSATHIGPPRRTEPSSGALGPAAASSNSGRPQANLNRPPPSLALATARRLAPPEPPLAGTGSRGGHLPWPPACPPHQPLLAPTKPAIRPLATPRPPPRRPRPVPPPTLAGFRPEPRRPCPRDHIAEQNFFSRAFLQFGNSNSKVIFLILVNCVENRRKIRKMQNQFCWIRCEISHNCCYSCLSKFLIVFA
jgi:hypothetical protein